MSEYFRHHACPLCGKVHEPRFHSYPSRLVRNHESFENEEIRICVVVCPRAKEQGRQYTKRILPPFVIPECNISLEQVLVMYEQNPDEPIDLQAGAVVLGSDCEKTIRRHHRIAVQMLRAAVGDLAEAVALDGPFVGLPEGGDQRQLWWLFRRLKETSEQVGLQRGRQSATDGKDSWYVHPVVCTDQVARGQKAGEQSIESVMEVVVVP